MKKKVELADGTRDENARETGRITSSLISWIVYLVFIALILTAITTVYLSDTQDSRSRVLFGYSAYIVLTDSMQREIPQGSLALVKEVSPDALQIGDDITYLKADRSLITHRVVDIAEDHEQSGMRGFTTKGLENPYPDKDVVFEDNVVGKVIFHNLWLGDILSYIQDRVWLPVLAAVLLLVFFYALRRMFRAFRGPELPENTENSELVL